MEEYINKVIQGDCLIELKTLEDNSVDSIVTDPPYELGFMGKSWDNTGIANNVEMWKECLRVLKPGGYLLSFSGTRTYHRMASAIEDAGFEVRDMIEWVYGSGFPKSTNISIRIDKEAGKMKARGIGTSFARKDMDGKILENGKSMPNHKGITEEAKQWEGWGTALKPAHEPICMARKPLSSRANCNNCNGVGTFHVSFLGEKTGSGKCNWCNGTGKVKSKKLSVAENCLKWGTGGINIDESRVDYQSEVDKASATPQGKCTSNTSAGSAPDVDMSEVDYNGEKYWYKNEYKWLIDKWLNDEDYVWSELKENLETYDWCKVPDIDSGDRVLFDSQEGVCIRLYESKRKEFERPEQLGRFPANLIHDNSEEVRECFPESKGGAFPKTHGSSGFVSPEEKESRIEMNDSGNASRFFKSILYYPKASKAERNRGCEELEEKEEVYPGINTFDENGNRLRADGSVIPPLKSKNNHPTVKPIALMEYLIKMVTPKGGIVLDPFAGSGSTLVAAKQNGYNYIGIELTEEYIPIIEARLSTNH